jgi:5-methylcytosine-specific restriction protein A
MRGGQAQVLRHISEAMPARKPWEHDRPSRHARGYGTAWDKLRLRVMERDRWLCQPCLRNDRTAVAKEVDHIKPKDKGGTDDPANLQAICKPCHKAKSITEKGGKQRRKVIIGVDGWPIEG